MFIGPHPAIKPAAIAGLVTGLCLVAASLGLNYLFERRPFGLWLINGGYFTLQFTLYGVIIRGDGIELGSLSAPKGAGRARR